MVYGRWLGTCLALLHGFQTPPCVSMQGFVYSNQCLVFFCFQLLLVFDGIKMGANISVNGVWVGTAMDQHLRYVFPIGDILRQGALDLQLETLLKAHKAQWETPNENVQSSPPIQSMNSAFLCVSSFQSCEHPFNFGRLVCTFLLCDFVRWIKEPHAKQSLCVCVCFGPEKFKVRN